MSYPQEHESHLTSDSSEQNDSEISNEDRHNQPTNYKNEMQFRESRPQAQQGHAHQFSRNQASNFQESGRSTKGHSQVLMNKGGNMISNVGVNLQQESLHNNAEHAFGNNSKQHGMNSHHEQNTKQKTQNSRTHGILPTGVTNEDPSDNSGDDEESEENAYPNSFSEGDADDEDGVEQDDYYAQVYGYQNYHNQAPHQNYYTSYPNYSGFPNY